MADGVTVSGRKRRAAPSRYCSQQPQRMTLVEIHNWLTALVKQNIEAAVAALVGIAVGFILSRRFFPRGKTRDKIINALNADIREANCRIAELESQLFEIAKKQANDPPPPGNALRDMVASEAELPWAFPADNTRQVPGFIPRGNARRAVIIAVLNFKGGVGKTTLTANIGAVWAQRAEKPVLLVDLDYQQSLPELCLGSGVTEMEEQEHVVERLWTNRPNHLLEIHSLVRHVPGQQKLRLLGCGPRLPIVETAALFRWIEQRGAGDIRLPLRTALHAPQIAQNYDAIPLDCPPRATTACVNALAAADYVLIPVIPDWRSIVSVTRVANLVNDYAARVPPLFGSLKILGAAANRWNAHNPGIQIQNWKGLADIAKANHFNVFESRIPNFHAAAAATQFPALHADHHAQFRALLEEILGKI